MVRHSISIAITIAAAGGSTYGCSHADPTTPTAPSPTEPSVSEEERSPQRSTCPIPSRELLAQQLAATVPVAVAGLPEGDYQDGFSILEGPVWVNNRLLLSQINGNASPPPARLLSYQPGTTTLNIVVTDAKRLLHHSGSNGLSLDPLGKLVAARHVDGTVSYVSIDADSVKPIATTFDNQRFNSPNDLVFHSNGTLYFTDPDWQAPKPSPQAEERAYRVATNEPPQAIREAHMVQKPNGIILSRDESRLYIGGTNGLFRFPLDPEGKVVSNQGQKLNAISEGGVDGMDVDCAGNIYVTNGRFLRILDPEEQELTSITFPLQPTNVEIGGPNGRSIFITTLETAGKKPSLFVIHLPTARP